MSTRQPRYRWTSCWPPSQPTSQATEALRLRLWNRTPFFGNDDDRADLLMRRVYDSLYAAIDGRANTKGTVYHLNMLSTTCHVYFGKMLGATPNGRSGPPAGIRRHLALPGRRPQRADRGHQVAQQDGPDQVRRHPAQPAIPAERAGKRQDLDKLGALIRTYFNLGGHHIQFNVVDSETLRRAQEHPDDYRNLLVRVAGYSDYFIDLDREHQEEIISRTEQEICS